jgi:uncharacterized protein (TIGR02996 family)
MDSFTPDMDVTDGDALLRAILADPGDEYLRLVFADWLEENGNADRAALIRVQIELARGPNDELAVLEEQLLGPGGSKFGQQRREWALPPEMRKVWPAGIGGWEWHRGFPEVWHSPLDLWQIYGAELSNACPIRRVELIDREPQRFSSNPHRSRWTWFRNDSGWVQRPDDLCLLPMPLFDLLEPYALDFAMLDHCRSYPSRADALNALSDACLGLHRVVRAKVSSYFSVMLFSMFLLWLN